jgi:hypothetical protein
MTTVLSTSLSLFSPIKKPPSSLSSDHFPAADRAPRRFHKSKKEKSGLRTHHQKSPSLQSPLLSPSSSSLLLNLDLSDLVNDHYQQHQSVIINFHSGDEPFSIARHFVRSKKFNLELIGPITDRITEAIRHAKHEKIQKTKRSPQESSPLLSDNAGEEARAVAANHADSCLVNTAAAYCSRRIFNDLERADRIKLEIALPANHQLRHRSPWGSRSPPSNNKRCLSARSASSSARTARRRQQQTQSSSAANLSRSRSPSTSMKAGERY